MPGAEEAYDRYLERINNGTARYCYECTNEKNGNSVCSYIDRNRECDCMYFRKKEM